MRVEAHAAKCTSARGSDIADMAEVSVLMSVYRPNPDYFRQQLESINAQTFDDLELVVWNDCPGEPIDRELVTQTVTRFPVTIFEEGRNLGYIGAFGELSRRARGEYISYCDQDDVWLPEKIQLCMEAIKDNRAVAAVCDRSLMDGQGHVFCESVRCQSKSCSMTWKTGEDITSRAAFSSYCTGMTLIARRDIVQRFLPFVPTLPHDQQLAFLLSGAGTIAYVEKPLVRHRRYGTNASGMLAGVEKKQDYYDTRCKPVAELLDRYERLYPDDARIGDMRACCRARIDGDIAGLWRYRNLIPELYVYEIGLSLCPGFLFGWVKRRFFSKERG